MSRRKQEVVRVRLSPKSFRADDAGYELAERVAATVTANLKLQLSELLANKVRERERERHTDRHETDMS